MVVPRVVNACACRVTATVLDDYELADLVIIARMKAVTKGTELTSFGNDISHVSMVVEKVFKGEVKSGEEMTFGQGNPVLGCSWGFYEYQVGERYLLYLYRPEKPSDPFYVSTCNRSNRVENTYDDLLYLENIAKVQGRTRVSGVVDGDDENTAGQQVRITGKNKSYIATTDKNGVYELYDLPPGRYSLEPILKFGWEVDEVYVTREPTRADRKRAARDLPPLRKVWFTLRAGKHFGVRIQLRLDNKIAGRVTTDAGKPLERVCVSLVPVDSKPVGCRAFTNADGSFAIQSVRAGSYYLLLNHENIRSSYQPFPTLYYPGATNSEAAKVLTVKFGESIKNLNFRVRTLSETVKLQGTVRYADGRPASDRYVGFHTPKTDADVGGSINTRTDKHGRFSLTVLKGLRGELFSTYPPNDWEIEGCRPLKILLNQSGKRFLVLETPHVNVEANESKTFELKLPASPCR